jgi:soluble lytic murein transglycosylase-like protein
MPRPVPRRRLARLLAAPGICLAALIAFSPATRAESADAGERCARVMPLIEEAAAKHGLDAPLMAAIIAIETRFSNVRNKRSGARGLMQVMPSTGRRLGCGDLDDPRENLDCGATLIRRLLKRYDGSLFLALSGYHAGLRPPNEARRTGVVPSNTHYAEKVFETRTRLLREGCP